MGKTKSMQTAQVAEAVREDVGGCSVTQKTVTPQRMRRTQKTLRWMFAVLFSVVTVSCVAFNSKNAATISQEELLQRIGTDIAPLILDVRSEQEYAAGHIHGAILIPHDELPSRLTELAAYKDQEVVVYCRSGKRAGTAEQVLREAGFTQIRDLDGHILLWKQNDHPLEPSTASER